MLNPVNPVIYLPIEYKSREFDGKLALTAKLIETGLNVVIGQQWAMYNNLGVVPPGVVLFKSHNKIHHAAMNLARRAGHIVLALEEESLALISEESIARNCPASTYAEVDYILTTGDLEKKVHIAAGCDPAKLIVTGNPRVDVLKPKYRLLFEESIADLQSKYGHFILINTNFGIKNSKWGSVDAVRSIEVNAGSLNLNDPESVKKFDHMVEWEEQNSRAMFEAISRLSQAFKDRTFIVRPHPSESLAKIVEEYKNLKNVKVIHEGSHVPWTLATELLIHTSCTTGLEAAIAGKRANSMVTLESWASKAFLSNQVNPVFNTVDSLVEDVEATLRGKGGIAMPDLSQFQNYIRNISSTSSVDTITDFVKKLPYKKGNLQFSALSTPPRNKVLLEKCSITQDEMEKITSKMLKIQGHPPEKKAATFTLGDSLFLLPGLNVPITQGKPTS